MRYTYKKITSVLLLVGSLFMYMKCDAQLNTDSVEVWIKQINSECIRINNDTAKLKVVQKDIFDQSSEGGFLRTYFDGNILRKAILTLFGENGQSTTEYYFANRQLIYSFQSGLSYTKPINEGKTEIKSREENHFYLKNQKLIRWYGDDNRIISSVFYSGKEKEIFEDLKIIH